MCEEKEYNITLRSIQSLIFFSSFIFIMNQNNQQIVIQFSKTNTSVFVIEQNENDTNVQLEQIFGSIINETQFQNRNSRMQKFVYSDNAYNSISMKRISPNTNSSTIFKVVAFYRNAADSPYKMSSITLFNYSNILLYYNRNIIKTLIWKSKLLIHSHQVFFIKS